MAVSVTSLRSVLKNLGLPIGLLAAWCLLYFPTLRWLWRANLNASSSLNLWLCGLALCGMILRSDRGRARIKKALLSGPRLEPLGLILPLGIATISVVLARFTSSHTLTAALFLLGSYGLALLYLPRALWRRGLPILVVGFLLLPVQDHLDALVGFPLRVATARFVWELLVLFHVPATSSEAILVLENGIAHVDLPCSGVRSLWAGALFFSAATWLYQRRLDVRWFFSGVCLFVLLLCANAMRVFFLVTILLVLNQHQLAESLHVPLGALGFVAACAVSLLILRRSEEREPIPSEADARQPLAPIWVAGSIGVLLALTLVRYQTPAAISVMPAPLQSIQLPAELRVHELSLTAGEEALFFQHGGVLAHKWRLEQPGLEGSLLLVVSKSFRAHHPPEVCLAASGLQIDGMRRTHLSPDFPARMFSIDKGQRTAYYWFQSFERTTDSLLLRTLSGISLSQKRRQASWALVTVLFDAPQPDEKESVRKLMITFHDSVYRYLVGVP